jgi:hypothetical protein
MVKESIDDFFCFRLFVYRSIPELRLSPHKAIERATEKKASGLSKKKDDLDAVAIAVLRASAATSITLDTSKLEWRFVQKYVYIYSLLLITLYTIRLTSPKKEWGRFVLCFIRRCEYN